MHVNQNVNAANFLLVSSQTNNAKVTKEDSADSLDFASVLKNTNSNQQQFQNNITVSQNQDVKTTVKQSEVREDTTNVTKKDVADVQSTSKEKAVDSSKEAMHQTKATQKTDGSAKQNDAEKATKTTEEVVESVEDAEKLSDEELAVLLETVGELLNQVMERFNLNVEELTVKLEEFGMEPSDLLTADGLKEFFLQMNGAEVSDLVVDENLNAQLQTFMSEVAEELESIQDFGADMEAVVSGLDVETILDKAVDETVLDGAAITNAKDEMDAEKFNGMDSPVHTDEPEVIVNDSKKRNTTGDSDSQEQSNSNAQQSASQETTITEHTVTKQQNTFENPILNAIQNAVNNVENTMISEQPVQQTDIVRQIVEQVRLNMNQQTTSLELQLYPEHLGRIQINVVAKEGVMTASIVAETEAAKQAIEAGLLNLKEAMEQQDLKVDAIEVMVSTTGFEHSDESQDSSHEGNASKSRRNIDFSELGEEMPVEDEAEIEKMKATGSSVSYRA